MIKNINVNDRLSTKDMLMENFAPKSKTFRTRLIAKDEYGQLLFDREENMTVLGGAIFVLEKLWGIRSTLTIDTINNIDSINTATQDISTALTANNLVCLWGIGIGGSGDAFGSVNTVHVYEHEIGADGTTTTQMIPFRAVNTALSTADKAKYFLAKSNGSGYTYYYGKTFESTPFIRSLWQNGTNGADGTEITSPPHASNSNLGIDTFVEMALKISSADVREYFTLNDNIAQCRINTIGLFTGQPNTGATDYQNVKLFSKFNFDNEPLNNTKEINFTYRIYAN